MIIVVSYVHMKFLFSRISFAMMIRFVCVCVVSVGGSCKFDDDVNKEDKRFNDHHCSHINDEKNVSCL